MTRDDEFYIGYEPVMPPGLGRRVRIAVALAALALLSMAVVVTGVQQPLATSAFDYGHRQAWTGLLVRTPAPALLVPVPHGYRRFWLVGRGKHGADEAIGTMREGWTTVTGTLISRDSWRMIEIASAQASAAPPDAPAPPSAADDDGRELAVRGEIVDSKCFLGVMNPGERVVHRDCAIRCLSGGVPPMLAYTTEDGRQDLAVIVDGRGRLLHDSLHHAVGRSITARGRLFTINGQPVFQLDSFAGASR